jgi:3-oxoacyl-[acyl-carrier protein] reductase
VEPDPVSARHPSATVSPEHRPLAGKVALITGASRGIGAAVVKLLAHDGADLVLTSTREGGADLPPGAKAIHVAADLSTREGADRVVAAALEKFGRVDVLVNNAGVVVRGSLEDSTDEEFDRVLQVNLSGPFYLCRRLIPQMVQRGWGRVVNVSSISGRIGSPHAIGYAASKWGVNGLTLSLAEAVAGTGVTVNAVLPGSVDTEMLKGSGYPPKMNASEVAGVIRYLCAEAPAVMNGSLVEVFG